MKHTLIETLHDVNQHAYVVTIGTDMGQFTGAAQCHEEDYEFESEYFGYELAELQAEIAYARAKRDHWNSRLKALTDFWKKMRNTRTYDVDAYWVKQMRKEVDEASYNRCAWAKRIIILKDSYRARIVDRDATNQRLRAKGLK